MLPQLLYLGDVPVESSYHGSTLLYRLLQRYPPDRLKIIEGNLFPPRTGRRLAGVSYATLDVGRTRVLNSRVHDWYSWWLLKGATTRVAQVPRLLAGFAPAAVLTVGHGFSWMTAARLAGNAGLPLHMIVHDDWPRAVTPPLQARVDRVFGEVYRQAASRLCTSPFMVDEYERRYGARGTVLLPYRAVDAPAFSGVAERLSGSARRLVCAFAGTINSPGYATLLRQLAQATSSHDGEVLIFGPITEAQADAAGLALSNVRLGGLLKSDELLSRLRSEADILFVPMSFAPEDRANMQMGFPSKLTDYTAVGLPLLICGPPYCSAVRWAHDNPGVAEVVASDDAAALAAAIERLSRDSRHRVRLALKAQEIGSRDFSPVTADAIFRSALDAGARQ